MNPTRARTALLASRLLLSVLAAMASTWMAGCSDPEETTDEYVHVATLYTLTGFYITPNEGGHLHAVIDQWAQKSGPLPASPVRPAGELPVGMRVTLTPDTGAPPIELVGYGNTTTASGGGYQVSLANIGSGRFSGYISGPGGSGSIQGLVGSPDSIEVYLGTFSGDSLHGRWNFAVPDTAQHYPYPDATSFRGLAWDSGNAYGQMFVDGYYVPSDTAYSAFVFGFGPGTTNWFGQGDLFEDKNHGEGLSDVGAWSVTRYQPPVP